METHEAPIKAYSIGELAQLYGFTTKTILKWVNLIPDLGDRIGRYYNPAQVKKIFDHCGAPEINKK